LITVQPEKAMLFGFPGSCQPGTLRQQNQSLWLRRTRIPSGVTAHDSDTEGASVYCSDLKALAVIDIHQEQER